MSDQMSFPCVDVAVSLVVNGPRILAVYNTHWQAFTLPMTKRRQWQDPNIPPAHREEAWVEAAARAAAEWLGQTLRPSPHLLCDVPEFHQSDRSGVWTRYHYQVFRLTAPCAMPPATKAPVEWLTVDEFLDPDRRPIASSARHLLEHLRGNGLI